MVKEIPRHPILLYASLIIVALVIGASSGAQCRFRPSDTGVLVHDASAVAVIRAQWIRPVEKEGSTEYGEGYVTARVLETLKGRLSSDSVVIRTDSHMETSDISAYRPEHTYLVFLFRYGSVYRAKYGRFGVFPIDEQCKVYFWNKPGAERSYPNLPPKVGYRDVRKQIVDNLKKHGEYQPAMNAHEFNCNPVHFDPSTVGPSITTIVRQSSLIAIVEARWVKPADQPTDKKARLYSRVDAHVLEVLKGNGGIKSIVIGTRLDPKFGDAGAFCPMRRQLVFLKQDGSLYRAVQGRCGVFDMDGPYVIGWPKRVGSCCPRPTSRVGLQSVKKDISTLLSFIK
ncbi:MAG: hypothetical protein ACYC1M_15590 [Armatimonadota bacterium]